MERLVASWLSVSWCVSQYEPWCGHVIRIYLLIHLRNTNTFLPFYDSFDALLLCWKWMLREHPESRVAEATLTGKTFHVALVVVMRRQWLCKLWWKRSFDFRGATSWAEDGVGRGAPHGCQGHRQPSWRAHRGRLQRSHLCVSLGEWVVSNQSLWLPSWPHG